jgi:hypothetical protein
MQFRLARCARAALLTLSAAMLTSPALAADWGLKKGTPELQSAGPLAFGPDGILAVADPQAAAIFAIDTGDNSGDPASASIDVPGLNGLVADLLGSSPSEVTINDLAVNPQSGNVYLAVSAGGKPALVVVDAASGKPRELSLKDIPSAKVQLPDAPEDKEQGEGNRRRNPRQESITDLAYTDGKLLVSGVSNAAAPATLREIPFPFSTPDVGTSIEIYHGAHGRLEDNATPRVFVPFVIDGEPNLLAGFTCTPLVKFPLKSLEPGKTIRGTTVAELGNRNRPLDLIVYEKGGQSWLLMANNNRGVMKISTKDIEKNTGIDEPVAGGGVAGQEYETIEDLKGVVQLDRLNDAKAVILVQTDSGAQDLRTIDLP